MVGKTGSGLWPEPGIITHPSIGGMIDMRAMLSEQTRPKNKDVWKEYYDNYDGSYHGRTERSNPCQDPDLPSHKNL